MTKNTNFLKTNEQINRFVLNCFAILMLIISLNIACDSFALNKLEEEEDDVYTNERLDELENKYGKTTKELFGVERGDIKGVAAYSLAKDKGMLGGNEYFEVRTSDGKTKIFSMGRGVRNPTPREVDSSSVIGASKEGLDKRREILNRKLAAKKAKQNVLSLRNPQKLKSAAEKLKVIESGKNKK